MKTLFKIIAAASLAFTMVSCGTMNGPYGTNYPNNGTVYRSPDGTVYGRGDVYRDRNGNVYQNGRLIRTGDVYGNSGILGRNGVLYRRNVGNIPPGQAKKIYGGSARDYAPGQVRKRQNAHYRQDRNWRNDDRRWNGNRDEKRNHNKSKGKHR